MGNENYIMINGKKIPLTDEQIKLIQAEEPKKSPFDRLVDGEYYYVCPNFELGITKDINLTVDRMTFDSGNYCTDENIMRQHALHMKLNNLLWRYSMTHGGYTIGFNSYPPYKYYICYNAYTKKFFVSFTTDCKSLGNIIFVDSATAEVAIEEIVKPFVEGHPDFDIAKM